MVLIHYFYNNLSQFLDSQYDYTYFFYGLSFFFLALICFNIERNKFYRLPWSLLGFFALTHGISEWIGLTAITLGPQDVLTVLHSVFLGVSYFLLFEFARIGHLRLEEKAIVHWWVYLPIFAMVFVGSQSAVDGVDISIRYFLGFPAGLLAAFAIYRKACIMPNQKGYLLAFSLLLMFYAILTGLIVQKSDFLLAAYWNAESFYHLFGLPVQLVRGSLILLAAMVLWFCSSAFSYSDRRPFKYHLSLKLSRWALIWTIIILLGLGLALTNFLDYYANIQLIKTSQERRNSPLGHLLSEISDLEKAAKALSKGADIKAVVMGQKDVEGIQTAIQKALEKNDLRSCYVIDDEGAVIAFVGEKLREKFTPTPHISMLYFHQSLSGEVGYHMTPVSGNRKRVYSVSYPVLDDEENIRGFVIASKVIDVRLFSQFRIMGILITMFICIIILAIFIYLRKRESLIEFMDEMNAKLREVDRLKSDFLSVVSHDLKTPLTAISNAVKILHKNKLKNGFADKNEEELIEIIEKNTGRQKKMIEDLLDISKIEAGIIPLDIEYHDLVALINEVAQNFRAQANEKNIALEIPIAKEREVVPMDDAHIQRVLANLLGNAIRYSGENSPITIEMTSQKEKVTVSITDQGPGISKEDQEKIFDRFYQSADENVRRKGGSGLGLFIAKGLVEAHGGVIWLESRNERGVTFYFTLPKWRPSS